MGKIHDLHSLTFKISSLFVLPPVKITPENIMPFAKQAIVRRGPKPNPALECSIGGRFYTTPTEGHKPRSPELSPAPSFIGTISSFVAAAQIYSNESKKCLSCRAKSAPKERSQAVNDVTADPNSPSCSYDYTPREYTVVWNKQKSCLKTTTQSNFPRKTRTKVRFDV